MDKRLIEETFPVKEVSFHSAKEKNIRHGHISTLHIWWARRPLAASRATAYTSLIPPPKTDKELEEEKKFVADFSKWENTNNLKLLERARKKILNAFDGKPPKVLDPFGGGGSIPLECLRLGCETYSNDLNPVAVLIQKCTLEYPQKFGIPGLIEREVEEFGNKKIIKQKITNVLREEVSYWGKYVLNEAKKELIKYYPVATDGKIPIAYIWTRTVRCQNPQCTIEIPLVKQFWLSKKLGQNVALYPYLEKQQLKFKIVGDGYDKFPNNFNPNQGTISRATVTCPNCSSTISSKDLRKIFFEGKSSEKLLSIVSIKEGSKGKFYRIPISSDLNNYKNAHEFLNAKISEYNDFFGVPALPDEEIPEKSVKPRSLWLYGLKTWGDLFNHRQKLSLVYFSYLIRKVYIKLKELKYDDELSTAIVTYLALGLDRLVDFGSKLCVLNPTGGRGVVHSFGRQAFAMTWDYAESNPFNEEGAGWVTACEKNEKWITNASFGINSKIKITQGSILDMDYPANYFDAIFTDPPYYDNINYAELSDFFYVWLKRSVGYLYPELFITATVPNKKEIIANPVRHGNSNKAKNFFESNLANALQKIYNLLRNEGIATVVYAHKSTSGWETLVNSILLSKFVITAAYPIKTEMAGKLNAQDTASLMSSIYMVCKKYERLKVNYLDKLKQELKEFLSKKLDKLWLEGISGSDFFIAAIGSSLEVFSKYDSVIDYKGNEVTAVHFLNLVRSEVTDYAVRKILHNGFAGEISDMARFYVLFRWEFGTLKVEFDEVNKLAHSCHIDLAEEWNKRTSFIKKDKEFISILGPQDREIEDLEDSSELIDVLHLSLKYWEKNRKTELNTILRVSGFGKSDAFFRVAQAIAETLPPDNKEKKLLEGFLNLREKIISTVSESKGKYSEDEFPFKENEE